MKKYNPKFYHVKDLKNKSGIYQIRNLINNKIYVGSAVNLKKRFNTHLYQLKTNIHENYKLQRDFDKYGEQNFIFEVIEFCKPDVRYEIEQYWLDKFYGKEFCYNKNPIANKPPTNYGSENPRAKTIICLDDKNIFYTIDNCVKYYHMDRSSLNKNIRGFYNKPARKFTYLTIYNKMLEDNYTDEMIYKKYNDIISNYDQYLDHVKNKHPLFGKDNSSSKSII